MHSVAWNGAWSERQRPDRACGNWGTGMGSASEYFHTQRQWFAQTRTAAGDAPRCDLRLAGRRIRIEFLSSRAVAVVVRALRHLAVEAPVEGAGSPQPPDLTVCCWDDLAAGGPPPPLPFLTGEAGLFHFEGPPRIAWEPALGSLAAFDPATQVALWRTPDLARIPAWEQAGPLRRILHWWASAWGGQLVHVAAVGDETGGVLLVGRGGSGKSTTALSCLGTQVGYLADDYCLVDPSAGPRVYSLYASGKANRGSIARLKRLQAAFAQSSLWEETKQILFLGPGTGWEVVSSAPLRAIVLPQIVPTGPASLAPASKGETLRALAPSTLFQMPGERGPALQRLTTLVQQLPCWSLRLGPDPDEAVPLLQQLAHPST